MIKGIFTALMTLIIVVVILYFAFVCTKYIGKGVNLRNKSKYMKIIDQMVLGQDKSIAIVKIGERHYIIGISSSQITILSEVDEDSLIPLDFTDETGEKIPDFKELFMKLGNKGKQKNGQ